MTDKRTVVINIAILLSKAADHQTTATQLLKNAADLLMELDDKLRKPELEIVKNPIAESLAKGVNPGEENERE